MTLRTTALAAACAVLATACVTINVYFPEAAIKDLSQQIEEQVAREAAEKAAREAAEPPAPPPAPDGGGSSSGLIESLLGIGVARAQDVAAPEVTSPAIRKLIEARGGRLAEINAYKERGVIGENRDGLVEARALDTLVDLRARAEVQRLVKAENADREKLFEEIAVAKGVDPSQTPKVRATYAATLREKARPGEWIQAPDGSWKQK